MVATRQRGENPNDLEALYEIQCLGNDSILRSFVSKKDQGRERTTLLEMLDHQAENPVIMLYMAISKRDLRPDNGYDLKPNEATAIIIQSRALGSDGRTLKGQNTCEECASAVCGLGVAFPFTECAGVPTYNFVAITCANCIWMGCDCDLTQKALQ